MDVTPMVPAGRQVIESYGERRFRVSGTLYESSVLVFPDRTLAWDVADIAAMTVESLTPVLAAGDAGLEVLLIGCGPKMALIPTALRAQIREHGVVIEPMDTGAACRTYNVLLSEERRIAAALIAID